MSIVKDSQSLIHSLTGLRFYAAFLVFVHHVMAYLFGIHGNVIGSLGHLGVSVFFVLSGFVLYINYVKPGIQKVNVKKFYIARFARIYPVFLLTTFFAIPIQLLSPTKHYFWEPLFLNIILLQSWFPISLASFNEVAWTIGVEAFFYVLFPILVTWIFLSKRPLQNVTVAFGLYTFYMITTNILLPDSFITTPYFPPNRLAEFMLGMMGGYLYQLDNKHLDAYVHSFSKNMVFITLIGLALFLILVPTLISSFPMVEHLKFLIYMLPSLVIIILLAVSERNNKTFLAFNISAIVFGGEISYSLYLIHNLFLNYMKNGLKLVFKYNIHQGPLTLQIVLSIVALVLALYSAYLLYRWVEIPGRRFIRERFQ